jgi:hypothetical protein
MIIAFDPNEAPIILEGWVTGPRRTLKVRLALDTGSTGTLIRATLLTALGYNPATATRRRNLRAATGGAVAPVLNLQHLLVLGQARTVYAVAAHELPAAVTYDGLLGLDFFRGLVLKLDFARGLISLFRRRWWQFWR